MADEPIFYDKSNMDKMIAANAAGDDRAHRIRRVLLSPRTILAFLYWQDRLPTHISICRSNLPQDFKVLCVRTAQHPQVIEVIIQHDSFEPVPLGEYPPQLDLDYRWEMYALATDEELARRSLFSFPEDEDEESD